MSDDAPTITITRGSRKGERGRFSSFSQKSSRSSGGLSVPGPIEVASQVVRGVQKAWWVGLGVLGVVGDTTSRVFDVLVEEGRSWEQAQRERALRTLRQLRSLANDREVRKGVEERIQKGFSPVLRFVDVPHRDEIDELRSQVEALHEQVDRLSKRIEEPRGADPGSHR